MSHKPLLLIPLNANSDVPLHLQLYRWLRDAILAGRFAPHMRLPSTRALAAELHISRNTVDTAYSQLAAEGYIQGQHGSGTFVAPTLPDEILQARSPLMPSIPVTSPAPKIPPLAFALAFNPHTPAFDKFPMQIWSQLVARHARKFPRKLMGYSDSAGLWELRVALANYLRDSRAVNCEPPQILIVNGSQQALDLCARVLLNPNDAVWMEDPGYFGARNALQNRDVRLIPVHVDEQGLNVGEGRAKAPDARMAYVTPSFQFPLGVTMPVTRRLELLAWAHEKNAWILEDDYNSEYRYTERPLASLQGLDTHNRVIYLGTFSKVLFPALRLGYMVVPSNLVDSFLQARLSTAIHSPILEQLVVADFIQSGHFARHIRRMRLLYAERQARLLDAAQRYLSGVLEVEPKSGGMHVMGWLPKGTDDISIFQNAAARKLLAMPLSFSCMEKYPRSGVLLGYAGIPEGKVVGAVRELAEVIKENPNLVTK